MAVQGNLCEPYIVESVVDRISLVIASRFPTPASILGYLIDVEGTEVVDVPDKVTSMIAGAVYPESLYLEPTVGQIWPR